MAENMLTDEECEILLLLAQGRTQKYVAEIVNISYARCRATVKSACKKLDAINLTDCVVKAVKAGYIK